LEVLPILPGGNSYQLLKDGAHCAYGAETALVGNSLETLATLLEPPASGLHAQSLYILPRRDPSLPAKDSRKIPRAHGHTPRERLHVQRRAEILEHPGLKLAQRFAIAQLHTKGRTKLGLPARTAQIEYELSGNL
jgi:hypothetical protein